MKMKMHVALIVVLLGAAGCHPCATSPIGSGTTVAQKILFETEYINRAWGYHHMGMWIDSSGTVWRYELAEGENKLDETGIYEESDLLDKYMHKKEYVATVSRDTLRMMYERIGAAAAGQHSDTTTPMADAGTVLHIAWVFNPASGTYREVGLRMRGDQQSDNLAPEARAIADWLDRLWETTRK